ncbi:MAG: methyltransferase domain-containing protein [Deltaproteobacteria bacterium]|nr:methyltransferase domain-containing protein [Deltaproteobacteria bacterium]
MRRKRLRQHLNPLKLTALVPRAPLTLPSGRPIDVELGCADARCLIELARRHPERHFVGLDIREAFLAEGRERVAALNLSNCQLEVCNLLIDTPHLFANAKISRFLINFPDPWFKRRQRARRWFNERCLADLVAALKPEGRLIWQSDVWELTLEAMGILEANGQLTNCAGAWRFLREPPLAAQTTRELICLDKQLKIWRLAYQRG